MLQRSAWLMAAFLGTLLAGSPSVAEAPTAQQIMGWVHARPEGEHSLRVLHMQLRDARGNARLRVLRSLQRKVGTHRQSLLFFLSPAEVRGTAFLSHEFATTERDTDQWLYLPALRRTKRIATGDKSARFMGSDLSYSDLTRRDPDAYHHRLVGEGTLRGARVWQIESTPRSTRELEATGYTRSLLFVRADNHFVVRSVHWLREEGRRKYVDVLALEEIEGIWVATRMHVATRQGDETLHETLLTTSQVDFRKPLGAEHFSLQALARGPQALPAPETTEDLAPDRAPMEEHPTEIPGPPDT